MLPPVEAVAVLGVLCLTLLLASTWPAATVQPDQRGSRMTLTVVALGLGLASWVSASGPDPFRWLPVAAGAGVLATLIHQIRRVERHRLVASVTSDLLAIGLMTSGSLWAAAAHRRELVPPGEVGGAGEGAALSPLVVRLVESSTDARVVAPWIVVALVGVAGGMLCSSRRLQARFGRGALPLAAGAGCVLAAVAGAAAGVSVPLAAATGLLAGVTTWASNRLALSLPGPADVGLTLPLAVLATGVVPVVARLAAA